MTSLMDKLVLVLGSARPSTKDPLGASEWERLRDEVLEELRAISRSALDSALRSPDA